MSTSRDFHHRAMGFAVQGFMAQMGPDPDAAVPLFEQALELELAAIAELPELVEPTYSVLHRSAGWMAFHCRQFRRAEQLASKALAGEPPADIAAELRDLLEQSNFHRHLNLNGVALQDDELQISFAGPGVSRGLAPLNAIYGRLDSIEKLIHRTAERKLGRQFREGGQPVKEVRDNYRVMVSVPREGSFAVTLKFGSLIQPAMPGMSDAASVMNDFMRLIELINQWRDDAIQNMISDEAYLRNFFNLAKRIAPDGKSIRQVGFTAIRNGNEHSVSLTRPAGEIIAPSPTAPPDADEESVVIRGVLRFADAISGSDAQIRVVDSESKAHPVDVPAGLMDDIVRPMWNLPVTVSGTRRSNQTVIRLNDIWLSDQDGDRALLAPDGGMNLLL